MFAFIYPLLSAFFYGLVDVWDKYVVTHRIKHPLAYGVLIGIANMFIAIIIALFLDWSTITAKDFLFPALSGILFGIGAYIFYAILKGTDISHIIGFIFSYPLVVAFLSFIFLKERLSPLGYFAVILILVGVISLSIRMRKLHSNKKILIILACAFLVGLNEFFLKIATISISEWNGTVITMFVFGLTMVLGSAKKTIFKQTKEEIKNLHWAIGGQTIELGGLATLYFGLASLPATVVAAVTATQPIVTLVLESLAHKSFGNMVEDTRLIPKLFSITLIVIGVIILSFTI